MKTVLIRLATSLLLLAAAGTATAAQQVMRRVEQPTPIDASDPIAIRSAAIVKLILAGDKEAATALLGKEADAAYVSSGKLESDLDAQIKRLSSGKYTVSGFDQAFGADVLVHLKNDRGDDANIVVRYNGDKKVTGFAQAKIQRD